jgi:hypothetical protein
MTGATAKTENVSLVEMLNMYDDLCKEIEYFEALLKETEKEWRVNRKLMFINPTPSHNGGLVPVPMDRVAENMDKVLERYKKIERLLKAKKKLKKTAEEILGSFEGIDYQVAYKRFVEKKKLELIAIELDYSIDGIKKISSRITKALTRH